MTRRQKNIIRNLCFGNCYFSQGSPRMTLRESEELAELGFHTQSESCHGADTSAGRVYTRRFPYETAIDAGIVTWEDLKREGRIR